MDRWRLTRDKTMARFIRVGKNYTISLRSYEFPGPTSHGCDNKHGPRLSPRPTDRQCPGRAFPSFFVGFRIFMFKNYEIAGYIDVDVDR